MSPTIFKIGKFRARKKIAAFDYDWTLVKPASGGTFPKNIDDWKWLNDSVVMKVKEAYERGFAIIVFTNQSKTWKCDQIRIALETIGIPILVAIGMDKVDQKPAKILFESSVTWKWDKTASYFVGDALGRRGDWSDSDKVFAENVGFKTIKAPEDVFPYQNNSKPSIKITPATQQEVVIMIGYPGSGKSTIAQNILGAAGYEVLSGDELKTSVKMIKKAESILEKEQRSVVFDATNPSKKKRSEYIDFAKKWKLPVRCIYVATNLEESMARNQKRPTDKIVPRIAYNLYKKNFEEPNENEGCEVIKIE